MLTAEQLASLRSEVSDDPKGRGYAAHLPDSPGIVVDMLNALTETMLGPLHSTTAKAWAAAGPYAAIVDASNNTAHPCRASCLVIRESFSCGDLIHLESPDLQQMLTAWVQSNVATQAQVDDLYARAKQHASRAQVLSLPTVTVYDLIDAGVVQ
jgi:hypothetical protein